MSEQQKKRSANVLLNTCKDIVLAVITGKTNYMEVGRHRGMIANEQLRQVIILIRKWKIFEYVFTNQNAIHEERKCRLRAGNSYY